MGEEFRRVGHLLHIVRADTDVTTLSILSLTAVDRWCNISWLPWVRNIVLSSPVDDAVFQEWNLVSTLASDGNGENNFVALAPLELGEMFHEYLKRVLNLEDRVLDGLGEHADHVLQVTVHTLHAAIALILQR